MTESGTNLGTDPGLAAMIREVLGEELAKLKPATNNTGNQKESVSISNDADLNAFARHLVTRMNDPQARRDFEAGRLEFTLSTTEQFNPASNQAAAHTANEHRIESGFMSERQIDALPRGLKRLIVGKAVRMTPLARDRARQLGIVIERMEP